jgi:ribosomal-protein-alanine N-acetyltransferase
MLSIAMGGHVRTGVEDNLYYDYERTRLASNEQCVRRLVRIAEEAGRPVANAEEARRALGLPPCVADADDMRIERARPDDMAGMLAVLQTVNMHHVPSQEMPELDCRCCFVARAGGRVVGMSGYKLVSETEGKTTLMAVDPAYRRFGLGMRLQSARLRAMAALGVKTVVTNADRPVTIEWYKKHFAYRKIGTEPKVHEFGDPDVHEWTTLEMDLEAWMQRERAQAVAADG